MREINASQITEAVARLCVQANCHLPEDLRRCMEQCRQAEDWPNAKAILDLMAQNEAIAQQKEMPICQDTGAACVFLELGQDVHVVGSIVEAVNEGVRRGYQNLRKSIVADPLDRVNTGDNTPAFLHFEPVEGENIRITLAPKGFGSENMSRLKMLKPSDGVEGVKEFVLETVRLAGPNPCPPMVVGVGVGGTFETAALLSKKALLRPVDQPNPLPFYAELERTLLEAINQLGIGPQGFGGKTTALAVSIEQAPTHIAGLPVAVNIGCHVTRRATEVL